ncbi:peptidyl-prolyl cis-trans isomerase B-like isoform X2 [Varroa jacobsoni]|uniref:Peptidyl-prolyl cis-trans isomerase n=1 Tax=Varroa destructor TaxID=109461 RepID=A0A7M7MIG6_VARDE|nr:peptidyl-prolyl cis-trans isomerase B-like isoform X2 [Varroa destructor]XP_022693511.1 peptidyl-prolyl cis-trans isomerase B-like isoform X2 [Varroa jacobsoni]
MHLQPRKVLELPLVLFTIVWLAISAESGSSSGVSNTAGSVSVNSLICSLYPCYRGFPVQTPVFAPYPQHTHGSHHLKPDLTITHHVNFVINQGNKHVGTIVLGLYGRVAPRTVRNFVEIASGRQPKKYEGTAFHRVIQKFMLQGGDVDHKNGLGSWSIYGPQFEDENFILKHTEPYVLSMANAGKVLEGTAIVKQIEQTKTDHNDAPVVPVYIVSSTVQELLPLSS